MIRKDVQVVWQGTAEQQSPTEDGKPKQAYDVSRGQSIAGLCRLHSHGDGTLVHPS